MPESTELRSPRNDRARAPRRSGQTTIRVYHSIREQILDGVIPQGAHLSIQSIADALDASNGPVISALGRLTNEGLLVHQRGHGYRVKEWTPELLENLLVVRRALETEAARLAATRATPDDIAGLQKMVDQMAELVAAGRRADAQLADVEFHIAIAELSRSAGLIDALRRSHLLEIVQRRLLIYEPLGDFANLAPNHQLLLDAIASGAPEVAGAEMHEHLSSRDLL